MTIEGQIRVVGILAVLFCLYSLWMGQMTATGLLSGYTNPVLALELAANGSEIDAINRSENGKATEFIQKHLPRDFGYIGIYVVFFCCLALLLIEVGTDWSKYLGWGAVVCALIAGGFDVIENLGMRKAVATSAATDSLANSIRYPSLAKWALLFVYCLLVGVILSRLRGWFLIPGLAFLIAALLGLSGVTLNLLNPKFYWMFPASILFLGLAIVCIAITFTLWPHKVLNKFLEPY